MKKSTLLIIGVVVLGVCCLGVVGVVLIGGLAGSDTASPLTRDSGDPGTAPTPVPPAPSFEEIRQQHDVMTEAQWKQYRKQIEGTQAIDWRGWVDEVTGNPGQYKVMIDMDSPDEFLSYPEVGFAVTDDVALALQKDQPLAFTGQIESALDMLGSLDITLEHTTIATGEIEAPLVSEVEPTLTPVLLPPTSTPVPPPADTPALPTDTPAPSDTPVPPTDTPEPPPLYLGDVVEQGDLLLSAVAVEDPTTPGMLYDPEVGKKLIGVEIIVGNVSGEAHRTNPLNATLLDSEGFTYQPELAGRDGQIATTNLSPGEKVKGWIAFEVPEGTTPAIIKYTAETFGGEALQASLTQPPEGYVPDTEALSVESPEFQAKLGDVFEQDGYSLSATAVEDPTTPGMLYEAEEGQKLVAVEIVVGNESGETHNVNPLNAILVDSNGFVYTSELGGRDDQIATVELNTGEKVKGWVAFTVPENATLASIKYMIEMFEDKFLQVGLTE